MNRTASIQASSYTSLFSVNFLVKIEQEMPTKTVLYTDIPSESRRVSPMDFCSFVLLKCASSKYRRLCGLGKLFNPLIPKAIGIKELQNTGTARSPLSNIRKIHFPSQNPH
ncbi:hypothetical protein AVEN_5380-1 [Araneus ventricosus]|uniref:Uncharacterized protein n=1 Tax=Araneus ventricosus TaxID=182803 RepID=A0A4Y2NX53_ARAVE|nr:hypothetical protein AVEN_5380-1 [Araneus ventricosus]